MGRPIGPEKVHRYSMEFKLTAVKLSGMRGVQVQTVANALEIHPFMLSRWGKEARDGMLRGRARRVEVGHRRELKRLQMLEREHAMLQEEHELLKKAIRFCSAGRRRSSRSLTASAGAFGEADVRALRRHPRGLLRVAAPGPYGATPTGPKLSWHDPLPVLAQPGDDRQSA